METSHVHFLYPWLGVQGWIPETLPPPWSPLCIRPPPCYQLLIGYFQQWQLYMMHLVIWGNYYSLIHVTGHFDSIGKMWFNLWRFTSFFFNQKGYIIHRRLLLKPFNSPVVSRLFNKRYGQRDWLSTKMHFTNIGNPVVQMRRSYNCLISTVVFHILVS